MIVLIDYHDGHALHQPVMRERLGPEGIDLIDWRVLGSLFIGVFRFCACNDAKGAPNPYRQGKISGPLLRSALQNWHWPLLQMRDDNARSLVLDGREVKQGKGYASTGAKKGPPPWPRTIPKGAAATSEHAQGGGR